MDTAGWHNQLLNVDVPVDEHFFQSTCSQKETVPERLDVEGCVAQENLRESNITSEEALRALQTVIGYLEANPGITGNYGVLFKQVLFDIQCQVDSIYNQLSSENAKQPAEESYIRCNDHNCQPDEHLLKDNDIEDDDENDPNSYNMCIKAVQIKQFEVENEFDQNSVSQKVKEDRPAQNRELITKWKNGKKRCCGDSRKKFKCQYCDKSYSTKDYLAQHERSHTGKALFQCDQCDRKFLYRCYLMRHKQQKHPQKDLQCVNCGVGFVNLEKLTTHMKTHSKPIKCNYCTKTFDKSCSFRSHMHRTHPDRERPKKEKPLKCEGGFRCSVCDKVSISMRNLKVHMRSHTGEQPHVCSICNKAFSRKQTLKQHYSSHKGERPHKCSVCKKSFRTCYNLKIHQRVHSGEKPYVCKICGKCFPYPPGLAGHMRSHAGIKLYLCQICGQEYSQHGTFKEHLRVHAGEKPYKCKICEKDFTRQGTYNIHMKRHEGNLPHQCSLCTRKFMHPCEVEQHTRVVHLRSTSVTCSLCGGTFSDVKHYKVHHCPPRKMDINT